MHSGALVQVFVSILPEAAGHLVRRFALDNINEVLILSVIAILAPVSVSVSRLRGKLRSVCR
jgi:hypothetical protein